MSGAIDGLAGLARKLAQRVNTVGYVCGAEHEIAEGLRESKLPELLEVVEDAASDFRQADRLSAALAAFLAATEGK